MKLRWNQGLREANRGERQALLEAETKAERVFAEEVVGSLCANSRYGIAECAGLVVACRIRRWVRWESLLYSSIECIAAHPSATREYRWRLHRVPGTRPVCRTRAK